MVQRLPPQYLFYLKCLNVNCTHPFCNLQVSVHTWFSDGPYLPFPPFPALGKSKYEGQCWGHFLPSDKAVDAQLSPMKKLLSQVLKGIFDGLISQKNVSLVQPKNACCPQLKSNLGLTMFKRTERSRESTLQTRTGQS